MDELRQEYVRHLAEEIQHPGVGVKNTMPGIRPLLDELQGREDAALGLLTGNFIEGARIKLEYFDLWRYFPCGAFGGDASNRNDLVPVAVQRARECGVADVAPANVLVVGDTPSDVECALVAGATPIAVATGRYTMDELREAGAEIVFKDSERHERLSEPVAVIISGRRRFAGASGRDNGAPRSGARERVGVPERRSPL